ncbi:anhydro-N-acetylmuramic acid kinase [Sideroxyarcus emersonii]|uniref:Anhydro-N-acetylmuramic acid kinase n=1 Tax=Sideroxyarcus emersonii TaxID=2764705 RepID=A0AAN1XBN1_9PROT|nr:anhydro-N-acetylmuramic acid kinase [Sideroxyarcus emersonii]BCK88378.1 anhydro-N-acetylmuramic acid kinase [Sideroxyarcus emersonii]
MSTAPDLYIGIMSGTSLDGIDAALVDLSQTSPRLVASHYQPYAGPLREALLSLHQVSHNELHQAQLTANQLAREYASATQVLLNKARMTPEHVQAIGCHGQTVRHRPEHGYTIQLNNPALLAELTGIHVVGDFRSRDIAAGGQGAPLVPAFHDRVLRHSGIHRVIVNIGGIANLTDLPPGSTTTGFDSGPGNLLMDAWIARHQGHAYDRDGAWAASGKIIPALLQRLLAESYFATLPPKSTGRDLFNLAWLERHLSGEESPADVQATLLALTGDSIAAAAQRFCTGAEELYLCGGGAHNAALVSHLQRALPHCRILKTETLGIAADWMEAIAFAWLAQQALHLHPANLPAVTGAKHPCVLGAIYPA